MNLNQIISTVKKTKITSVIGAVLYPGLVQTQVYNPVLSFDQDKEIYHNGGSIAITLGNNNVNGVGILLRLNKPSSVSFPINFEASQNSAPIDSTKLNAILCIYYSNWDGAGMAHIIYSNNVFNGL